MSKEKRKHINKGATGATHRKTAPHKGSLLHPCRKNKGATRVQQVATLPGCNLKN